MLISTETPGPDGPDPNLSPHEGEGTRVELLAYAPGPWSVELSAGSEAALETVITGLAPYQQARHPRARAVTHAVGELARWAEAAQAGRPLTWVRDGERAVWPSPLRPGYVRPRAGVLRGPGRPRPGRVRVNPNPADRAQLALVEVTLAHASSAQPASLAQLLRTVIVRAAELQRARDSGLTLVQG